MASPGCFATTIELALLPLARAGLLRGAIHVLGITGSSGSGVVPSAGTHHPVRAVNLKSYKRWSTSTPPRSSRPWRDAGRRSRSAFRAALRAGVGAAVARNPGHLLRRAAGRARPPSSLAGCTARPTRAEPFVRFLEDRPPEVAAVSGSNYAEVGFTLGPAEAGRRTLAVQAATDNLIKGGAGQAIQNMNLMLGLPETLSLEDPGRWP